MKDCYLVSTGSMLPGPAVKSDQIQSYLGTLDGENEVKDRVLRMNGIQGRHYAQTLDQQPTESVYSLAAKAVRRCIGSDASDFTFLSAGTTHAPFSGPGLATLIHDELADDTAGRPVEISSHSGICTSGAAAIASACRAIRCGEHSAAIAIGSEHASEVLKSDSIRPVDDRNQYPNDIRRSQWFMSVFLRFMLSDGAGAFQFRESPPNGSIGFRVDWIDSRSYAHETQLCMKLVNRTGLLSQDVDVLSKYLIPSTEKFLRESFSANKECIDHYDIVLPHLSSFFFRRRMEQVMRGLSPSGRLIPYWTNLDTAGNTGAASIFVMLDEYLRIGEIKPGTRLLLFVPESGQFNFSLISLTAVLD